MRRILTLAGFALAVGLGGQAQAASFPCSAAATASEKTICATPALNDQDVTMSVYYGIAQQLVAMGERQQIMSDQTAWLASRQACGASVSCIASAYTSRITTLQSYVQRAVAAGPF